MLSLVERRRRRVQATLTPRTTALTSRTTHALCRNDWMLSLRRTRWILNIHSRLRPHLPQRPTRYTFGTLNHKDLEIYYDDTDKGHDTFILGREITRLYYILGGSGYFTIDNRTYDLSVGMLVEMPPKIEYSYSGSLTRSVILRTRCKI